MTFPPLMSQTVNTQLPTAPQISSPSASTVSSSSSSSSLPISGQQTVTSTATQNYQNYLPPNGNYYPVPTIVTSHQKTQDASNQQQPSLPGSYGPKTMNFPPLMSEMVNIYLPTAPQISSPSASTVSLSSSSLPIGGQQAFTRTASRNYPNYPPINGNYCPVSTMLTPHQKTQVASNQQQLPLLPQPSLPSSYVIGGLKTMNFPPPMSQMVNTQFPTAPQISSASASASASTVSSSLPIGGQQAVRSTATPNYQNYPLSNGNYYPVPTIVTSHQKTQDASNQQQPSLPSSYVCGGSKTLNFPPLMSQTVNTYLPTAPQISSPSASSLPIGGQQAFTRTASRNYPNYPPINGNYYPDSTILTPHQKTQIASNQQQLPLPPQPPLSSSYIISQLKAANFPPPKYMNNSLKSGGATNQKLMHQITSTVCSSSS
ncbi:DNA-directed RNA polymerase II subunit RPB1-like [Aphidius gifuensis]|uniref:DNA-directed RNA polymerase II subunit RPB1-like n=1 Tax=Aphidius gifuensis TaxID=684658 RepID=UPI001CDB5889|nr:DNA-directed RNA polymerase II subunit RPB1-like [Aphidius gifuensis]